MAFGNRLASFAAAALALSALAMLGALGLTQRLDDEAASAPAHALRKERRVADWLRAETVAIERMTAPPHERAGPRGDDGSTAAALRRQLGSFADSSAERSALDAIDRQARALQVARNAVLDAARIGLADDARLRFERDLLPAAGALREAAERLADQIRAEVNQRALARETARAARASWLYDAAAVQAGLAVLLLIAGALRADPAARTPPPGPRVQPAARREAFDSNLWSLASARLRDADITDVEARMPRAAPDAAQPAARPDLRERA